MGEHVGEKNYPVFTGQIAPAAAPGRPGADPADVARHHAPRRRPVHRGVHRPRHAHATGRRDRDLIERAGLEVRDVHALREHYVWTVDAWYATFEANWDRVVEMVGEEVAPGLAALPRRRRAGLRGGPDGRRPDPRWSSRPPDGRSAPAAGARRLMTDFPWVAFLAAAAVRPLLAVARRLLGVDLRRRPAGRAGTRSSTSTWGLGFVVIAVTAFVASDR